jgi:Bifunctional DNA primase/polymerase, N-terminal
MLPDERGCNSAPYRIARGYTEREWTPVLVPYREKGPTDQGWQKRKITKDNVGEYFDGEPVNIGVKLGRESGGLCDVDLDCPEAIALAEYLLPETDAVFGRQSKPGSHRLYITELCDTEQRAVIKYSEPRALGRDGAEASTLVELRIGGGDKGAQTIFPGSVHPSGEDVRWDSEGEPEKVDGAVLKQNVAALAAGALLARHYPNDGLRHEAALVLGGMLARAGIDKDDIEHFVKAVALVAGDEEAGERGRSAAGAVDLLERGEPTPGLPRMRDIWGEDLANTVGKWLGLGPAKAGGTGDDAQIKVKQADILTGLAAAAELFHTDDGKSYADVLVNGHRETWPIGSKGFREWLLYRYYKEVGGAPSAEALRTAIEQISARARFDAPMRRVYVRIGGQDGKIYLDLADETWRVVEIDAEGWRVVDNPPVRFRRTNGMLPLPVPVKGSSVDTLRSFVNVKRDTDFVLLVSWVLAALRDCGPYPILKVWGEPGSAKSTLVDMLRALIDPNKASRRRFPREDRDLFIAASNAHVLSYDNISHVPDWLSNSLCTLATGGSYAKRTLYTDQDEELFEATRPVILNGVENFIMKHDLADRTIVLELKPIPDGSRHLESELKANFEAARPQILGALLDAVAHGLRMLPNTQSEDWPRMADFAHWVTACEGALWPKGSFRDAYGGNRRNATQAAIDDDPVASAVRDLVAKEPEWEGTTSDLLDKLSNLVGERQAKAKGWPTEARALTSRLQNAKASLRRIGIDIRYDKRGPRGRRLFITYSSAAAATSEQATHTTHATDTSR